MSRKNKARQVRAKSTPIRAALEPSSFLLPLVRNGIEAIDVGHHAHLDAKIRSEFSDSLELDDAMRPGHEQENRWDYLLGHAATFSIIALEPHTAKQDQIRTVVAKRTQARQQLRGHLRAGKSIRLWLWVSSGRVQFADTERTRRQLDQAGITFVDRVVLPKHLS
jgi:hypothetical protein